MTSTTRSQGPAESVWCWWWWWLWYVLSMMLAMIKMMIHVFNCESFSRFPMLLLCMNPSLPQSIYPAVDPFTPTYISRCLFRNSGHKDVMMCIFVCSAYCWWFRFRTSWFFAVLARLVASPPHPNQYQLVHQFVCINNPLVAWHLGPIWLTSFKISVYPSLLRCLLIGSMSKSCRFGPLEVNLKPTDQHPGFC